MRRVDGNTPQKSLSGRNDYRGRVEILRRRVDLLCGKDKLMMRMYLENGNTFYQMAQLAGVDETTISRRINRLARRLIDGEYIRCLQNREKFSVQELAIAKEYFLFGSSLRKVAKSNRLSYYRARQMAMRIKAIVAGLDKGSGGNGKIQHIEAV